MLHEPQNCQDKAAASGRSEGSESDRPDSWAIFFVCIGQLPSMESVRISPFDFYCCELIRTFKNLDTESWNSFVMDLELGGQCLYLIVLLASHLTSWILKNSIDKMGLYQCLLTLKPYTWKSFYLYVSCKHLFCYYECSWFDYKASVPSSGVLPALFFKAGREKSLWVFQANNSHHECTFWEYSVGTGQSQVWFSIRGERAPWRVYKTIINLFRGSKHTNHFSLPHRERSKTDNRFQKVNDRFLKQNCLPNKLALPETIWWELW